MSDLENVISTGPYSVPIRTFGASWPLLIAFVALLAVLGIDRFNVLADPDTYWHLATGRWILEHGAVPKTDPFSHSMPGTPWIAHEWLSALVLTGVFRIAGWAGLVVLTALVFACTLAYVMRFLLARMEPVHALLFTTLAASILIGHLLARPHVIAWCLLALWVGTLVNAGEQERNPPWWLLPLMVLWANLHGSFILGLALGAALALDAVLLRAARLRRMAARYWAGFMGLSVLASMLTPAGWHGLLYPVQVMQMTVSLDTIGEWLSPNFHQPQLLELWLMLMLALSMLGRVRLPWLRLVLVLGLIHIALKHQRYVSLLGLVTPFLMASPLAQHWRATAGSGRDAESLDRVFLALAAPARAGAVATFALLASLLMGSAIQSDRFAPATTITPEAAVLAAHHAGASGPVFNDYGFGGYLIYSGIPVFIDGRSDMYGDALMKRYLEALSLSKPETLQLLLDDYHIGWTLLAPGFPAVALLDRLPGWRRVFSDAVAVVHVRDSASTAH